MRMHPGPWPPNGLEIIHNQIKTRRLDPGHACGLVYCSWYLWKSNATNANWPRPGACAYTRPGARAPRVPLGGWESRASPAVGCAQARRHTHFGYIPPGSLHYISLERLNAGIMPERYYTTARDVPVWTKIVQTLRLSAELPWWESKILLGKIFCTNPHCQRRVICWHLEGAQTHFVWSPEFRFIL